MDHLPDDSFLNPFMELYELKEVAKKHAWEFLSKAIQQLELSITLNSREKMALAQIKQLGERLSQAYE